MVSQNKCQIKQACIKMTTRNIVNDYIATSLRKGGYDSWDNNFPVLDPPPEVETMRILGDQFEQAYFNTFDTMVESFDIAAPEANENFNGVAHVLFQNGIRWGRIVGLIVFSSKLSIKAMEINRPDIIDSIVTWTCSVLESATMSTWINQNHGWNGFVDYYRHPEHRAAAQNGDMFSWTRAWSVGVATIAGAAAVMNFFRS